MYTISKFAKKFSLSRSTLLYYESIGLIKAPKRNKSNYRLYSSSDAKRLEMICIYREMGIELKDIKNLIDSKSDEADILELALIKMENQINDIRQKQQKIMSIIENTKEPPKNKAAIFTNVLKDIGLSDSDLADFHIKFEKDNSESHHAFLKFLGFQDQDIKEMTDRIDE